MQPQSMVHLKETQALITWYWSKFLDKELKWCICHIDIHDKTTLLEKMYLGRDNIWLSQSRSWTTNFLLEIPTDQGGLRRVKSKQQETDWCEGNMAPTRQEVNKPELIAKRSQVFLLCQKDTFIRVLKKYFDCLNGEIDSDVVKSLLYQLLR